MSNFLHMKLQVPHYLPQTGEKNKKVTLPVSTLTAVNINSHHLHSLEELRDSCTRIVILPDDKIHFLDMISHFTSLMLKNLLTTVVHSEQVGSPSSLRRLQHRRTCLLRHLLRVISGLDSQASKIRHIVSSRPHSAEKYVTRGALHFR